MAGKYKTMTLIEEGEEDRLRQRQLKVYNPTLKSMVGVQEQIEKLLTDPELDDQIKYKILCFYKKNLVTCIKFLKILHILGRFLLGCCTSRCSIRRSGPSGR